MDNLTGSAGPLQQRVAQLEAHFSQVYTQAMQDIGWVNPALQVQAVDFIERLAHDSNEQTGDSEPVTVAEGVLITPWFMSALRLPMIALTTSEIKRPCVGSKHERHFGTAQLEFIVAYADALGSFETCSLFSNMHEFDTPELAAETAHEVLRLLREPEPVSSEAEQPARRAFLASAIGRVNRHVQ